MLHPRLSVLVLPLLLVTSACCCARPGGTTPGAPEPAAARLRPTQTSPGVSAREAGPAVWDRLLRTYVRGDYFDYAGLKAHAADRAAFQRFLDWQGRVDRSRMTREEQIAFYMNAYNSLNVKMILDHYPVHSPLDVPGYFDKIKHPVAGEMLTVSEAEYERLIAEHKDMRAHFGVVCSDRGCLPLMARAWSAETLDADLDAAARRFVADERHFKVDHEKKEIWISKIFEWYGEKFTQDPQRPARRPEEYLKHWTDGDVRRALESGEYKVRIIEWNWTLNEKHGT